jgi:hypothetical protein
VPPTPCRPKSGFYEQHVDIAVVIQVGEPGHVAIDDGQLGVRCCPSRGPRVEVPIVGRPRLSLTTGDIAAHFAEIYDAQVSKDTISRITDRVVEEMQAWTSRPLEPVYAAVVLDAINVKVRDGQVANRPVYAAIGVDLEGHKDILGMWFGDGESAKFWMVVLTVLRNRGVADVFFLVCDGLKGLPDSVNAVWPATIVQTSSVHDGGGGRVPLVTCAVSVRTCANVLPLRSRDRPVRPGRWRALYLPAGAAPI